MGPTNSRETSQAEWQRKNRTVDETQNRKIRALDQYWKKTGRVGRESLPGGYDIRYDEDDPNNANMTLADSTDWDTYLQGVDANYNQFVAPLEAYKNDPRFKEASRKASRIKTLARRRGKQYDSAFDGDFSDPLNWYSKADLDRTLAQIDLTYDDYFGVGASGAADQRLSEATKRKAKRVFDVTKKARFDLGGANDPDSDLMTSVEEKQNFEKEVNDAYKTVPTYDERGFNNVGEFAGRKLDAETAAHFGYQWNNQGPTGYNTSASVVSTTN